MKSKTVPSSLLLGMMALSSVAVADSYAPFANYRAVDATGRYYVVMKRSDSKSNATTGVPVAFEIVERRPGSVPVAAVSDPDRYERASGGNATSEPVKVREGDLVLGKGTLDRAARKQSDRLADDDFVDAILRIRRKWIGHLHPGAVVAPISLPLTRA
jgi:hypothetical protein